MHDKTKNNRVPRWVKMLLAVVAVPTALLAWWVAASPLFWGTRMADAWTMSRATLVVLGCLALVLAGLVGFAFLTLSYQRPKHATGITVAATLSMLIGVILLLPVLSFSPARQAYRSQFDASAAFAAGVTETRAPRPSYATRLNAVMAERILRASLQDSVAWIADDAQPQYSVVDGEPAWCVGLLAKHRVPAALDRVYTTGTSCLVEKTLRVVRANWKVRVPSTQGAYSTNLHKYVARLQRGLSISESDVRYYIQGGKPHMLAPVTKLVADGLAVRRVTGGFVTIDPVGKLALHSSAKAGEWPVPVVSYSTAEAVRTGLNNRSGYYCRERLKSPKCVKRAVPFEDTSSIDGAGGAADPNAGNATEFVLRRADGRLVMVTPLTPYGAARNVVGYLEVMVDELSPGRSPAATLYRVTPEASNIAVAEAVTASYTADIAWISEVNGDATSKAASRIFEITPAATGEVVATIGNETNPVYWLKVKPQLDDGSLEFSYCIHEYRSGVKLDCRSSIQPPARLGTLRGVDLGSGSNGDTAGEPGDGGSTGGVDIAQLSDEELAQLGSAVLEELARRAK